LFASRSNGADDGAVRVYLDDSPVESSAPTLASALAAGVQAAGPNGRVIVEVWADGQRVPDEQLADPPETSPYAEEIRFVSAQAGSLVKTVLMDVAEGLKDAQSRQRRSAELLQSGQTQPALEELSQALAMWDNARRAVQEGCSLMGLSLDAEGQAPGFSDLASQSEPGAPATGSDESASEPLARARGSEDVGAEPSEGPGQPSRGATGINAAMIELLAEQLAEVKRALAEQDWAALSDALAYDLEEQATQWREGLTTLSKQIETQT